MSPPLPRMERLYNLVKCTQSPIEFDDTDAIMLLPHRSAVELTLKAMGVDKPEQWLNKMLRDYGFNQIPRSQHADIQLKGSAFAGNEAYTHSIITARSVKEDYITLRRTADAEKKRMLDAANAALAEAAAKKRKELKIAKGGCVRTEKKTQKKKYFWL